MHLYIWVFSPRTIFLFHSFPLRLISPVIHLSTIHLDNIHFSKHSSRQTFNLPSTSISPIMANLQKIADRFIPDIAEYEAMYRQLHSNPELSELEAEVGTAHLAEAHLERVGFHPVIGRVGGHGVVGVLRNGNGPTVMLRAGLHTLSGKDSARLSNASTTTQWGRFVVPRRLGATHGCAHDVQAICLMGAAELLSAAKKEWSGTLICLFQPGLGTGEGAREMVKDRQFAKIPTPDVLLGQQVVDTEAGTIQIRSGPALPTWDRYDTVEVRLDVKTYDPAVRERVVGAIRRVVRGECEASGLPYKLYNGQTADAPAPTNDSGLVRVLEKAFKHQFGEHAISEVVGKVVSDDLSGFAEAKRVSCAFWNIGGMDLAPRQEPRRGGTIFGIPGGRSPDLAPAVSRKTLWTGINALALASLALLV